MSATGLDITDNEEMTESEEVVTMMDVLQEQQDFEDDANAVLGASDEKNCTYTKVNKIFFRLKLHINMAGSSY